MEHGAAEGIKRGEVNNLAVTLSSCLVNLQSHAVVQAGSTCLCSEQSSIPVQQQAACSGLPKSFPAPEHALLFWRVALGLKSAVAAEFGQRPLSWQARFAAAGAESAGPRWSPQAVQSVLHVQPSAESRLQFWSPNLNLVSCIYTPQYVMTVVQVL